MNTMRVGKGLTAAAIMTLAITAQQTSPERASPPAPFRASTPFPGQQRPKADPAVVARGKTLYGISCAGCHGVDLRGGDLGGPNLLRSPIVASDNDGELILPVIQGSRQNTGMPAIKMTPEDATVVSTYIHSVASGVGRQGTPPAIGVVAPSILVGNADEGRAYFAVKCGGCHSATGDLSGIATKIADPKALQNAWVSGGARAGGGGAPREESAARIITAVVTLPSGQKVEGRLIRIDDFLITLALADGTLRTFDRQGGALKCDIRDPMKTHRDLLAVYTDKDIHDVTAYLVTLK
jgi:cytochrome c oxidase cbb3-type subunit 3